jgi:signal transduction histidine kinase
MAAQVVATQLRLAAIERDWPAQREARIEAYGARVGGELRAALHSAVRLADAAVRVAGGDRAAAFRALDGAVSDRGIESGVAILDADGAPWAWAGRHRIAPEPGGDSLGVRASGYYVILETRRHSANRIIVASVLIWADSAVADRSRSLAERFRRETEVGLLVYSPGGAPENNPDIFDYSEPTTEGDRLLFSVQPVPPEQAEARDRVFDRGGNAVFWLALGLLAMVVGFAGMTPERLAALPALLWLVARAPVGQLLGVEAFFSSATLSGGSLGPIAASPAVLALIGVVLTAAAVSLWRRPPARGAAALVAAAIGVLVAPVLLLRLGQRIVPPPAAGMGFWLALQGALLLVAAPFAAGAAALLRTGNPRPPRARAIAGVAAALVAATAAVLSGNPGADWPLWTALFWVPALVLVVLPAPRLLSIGGIAAVLGTLAAATVWRANVAERLALAAADVARLGATTDPRARALLERFGNTIAASAVPETAAQLYGLWRGSELAREGYPVHLALWRGGDMPAAELPLDSLALPRELVGALARTASDSGVAPVREIHAIPAVPGVHQVLVERLAPDVVVTAVIGPRSALVAPDRLGRLLDPSARRARPYRLTLGSPAGGPVPAADSLLWRRETSGMTAERSIMLPGGARDIRVSVALPGPARLAVRGLLVLLLDVALLGLIWGAAGAMLTGQTVDPGWKRLSRSFRLRLALALAAFFVVPSVAFAVWSFAHFGQEAERGRDLLIAQTLRDAAQSAGSLLRTPGVPLTDALRGLSERVSADLALYRGGALVGTSAPVLRDLGVVSPLLDPRAFRALALEDALELTADGAIPALAERVGYRVVEFGPSGGLGVLVTPQVAGPPDPDGQQMELALVLLLATTLGILAAIGGAGIAARALSRPVGNLRRAALALGQGRMPPLPGETPPVEFEPVFGAFNRMAADVRASQRALEEARRRTDAVLATVGTGVVALDPSGRVLIANRQATELLGVPLGEGSDLATALPEDWDPLRRAVAEFLRDPREATEAVELSVGARRVTLQMAPLGLEVSGVVLALNDVTDLSRAERVLAWGEMARQVAHEIKNPLTPVRLGIQHLQRVYRDRRGDFEATLAETSRRILAEIDRLDTIARAFSRFAAPAEETLPLERVDLSATASEVVQLYGLAGDGIAVALDAPAPAWARARRNEVKEVLVNLLENSRNAGARAIAVRVRPGSLVVEDDGTGVPAELLPRIFEPQFSTNTSGSGLGLAIVRRLVESWGGTIEVASEPGKGTAATVRTPLSA